MFGHEVSYVLCFERLDKIKCMWNRKSIKSEHYWYKLEVGRKYGPMVGIMAEIEVWMAEVV